MIIILGSVRQVNSLRVFKKRTLLFALSYDNNLLLVVKKNRDFSWPKGTADRLKIAAQREDLSGRRQRGGQCQDQRSRIEVIPWILRLGLHQLDLSEQLGAGQSVYDRFRAGTKNGLWDAIRLALSATTKPS